MPKLPAPSGSPFAVLGVPPSADLAAVRRAFRSAALATHPDRNPVGPNGRPNDGAAFRAARDAFDALRTPARLDAARRRWTPAPAVPSGVLFTFTAPGASPRPSGLDAGTYPPARYVRDADGLRLDLDSVPDGWTPGTVPPPGGLCPVRVPTRLRPSGEMQPAFGVWLVFDGASLVAVFGPAPAVPAAVR